ncbi:hypothetical protein ACJX0J_011720 [Zea mays]
MNHVTRDISLLQVAFDGDYSIICINIHYPEVVLSIFLIKSHDKLTLVTHTSELDIGQTEIHHVVDMFQTNLKLGLDLQNIDHGTLETQKHEDFIKVQALDTFVITSFDGRPITSVGARVSENKWSCYL